MSAAVLWIWNFVSRKNSLYTICRTSAGKPRNEKDGLFVEGALMERVLVVDVLVDTVLLDGVSTERVSIEWVRLVILLDIVDARQRPQ